MRIINIILTSVNGGVEQSFLDYCNVLKSLGHEVLAILKHDAPYAEAVKKCGCEVRTISNKFGYHDVFAVKNIRKIIEEFDADTVFAHMGRSILLARKAAKKIKNKKVFVVAVNHSLNVKRSIGADLILSVNKEIFYRTIELGQDEAKSFIIPNALDFSDEIEVSTKINLKEKKEIVLGVMGRLSHEKSFESAIKTIKKLGQNFTLKIAGTGEEEAKLKALIKELNLENKIEFCGWIKDKKEFFNSIDIFLVTSKEESFCLVLLEAIKFRKPLISTACHGPKEILRDGIDGLLVAINPLENLDERLSNAVLRIVNEESLAEKIVENSFVRAKERYSYNAMKLRLKEIVG